MKLIPIRTLIVFTLISILSCNSKKASDDNAGETADLKDFPKEWVLAGDIAPPDSISRNYVILMDSSNSFLGGIVIKQNGNDWQMINSGFYYPGTFIIKSCKKVTEGEMVYYNFELQSTQYPTQIKIAVNFRHNPGQSDDLPSVFSCMNCDNPQDVLMVEKTVSNQFHKKSVSELQYD